jgi:hypothetical protein
MYSVFGYVKDENGTAVANAKVYPYFKKVDSGSSESKWADYAYTTDNFGYYSFDIEDVQLLNVTGSYKKGTDKVYIAIVYNSGDVNDQEMDSLTFTHALFYDHTTVTAVDLYQLDLTIEEKRAPVITSYGFPPVDLLTEHPYTMSETSYVDTGWKALAPYSENEISQKYIYSLVSIFDGHRLVDTVYTWGEIPDRLVADNSNDTYVFDIAGVYDLKIAVREAWNTETVVEQQVTVKYNQPIPDFSWDPTETNNWQGSRLKGQELVTFTNESSDLDNRTWDDTKWGAETYTYDWTITDELQDGSDNTQVYLGEAHWFQPTHAFQSAGTKTITLVVHWNDGFVNHTETIVKTLEVYAFDIVPDFDWDTTVPTNRSELVTFNPSLTSGDIDKINRYDWVIEDNYPAPATGVYTFQVGETSIYGEESPDNSQRVDNTYIRNDEMMPAVRFHSDEPKEITLTMTYYNGWVDATETISKTLTPTKYVITPTFSISDTSPMGRDKVVEIVNTTDYVRDGLSTAYTIDWQVDDYYTECNLSNPTPGTIVDNTNMQVDVPADTNVLHSYHNTDTNNVELTVRYDDGWQMITSRLVKTVTPEVYPAPVPEFSWTPTNPKGRHDLVQISDDTVYDYARYRGVDWTVSDEYSACNLDNPSPGIVTDNTQVYTRELHEYVVEHYYQNEGDNSIYMKIYYDDGFCEREVDLTQTLTTIVYDPPVPSFTWSPLIPKDRYDEVTFTNTTEDQDSRFRAYDWTIEDHYNKFNPDNVNYGVSETDNTQVIAYDTEYTLGPTHMYQDVTDESISMVYYYDDGFCERTVETSDVISKDVYTITPDFEPDIMPVADGFVGKKPVVYTNTSTGDVGQMLDEKWTWNDREFGIEADVITVRDDQVVYAGQEFTWQTPSRKPYSAIGGSTAQNINKDVTLEIRIDTGWRDDTELGNVDDLDNLSTGGQVYWEVSNSYEATPNEVSSNITYETNVEGYTH